jgi:hypothetical protein
MQDVQGGTSTELRVSEVRYDIDLPEELFVPERLPRAVASPLWQGYGSRATAKE